MPDAQWRQCSSVLYCFVESLERSQPPWLLAMKDDFLDLGDEPGSKHLLNASIAVPSESLLHMVHFFSLQVSESGVAIS